ncbi:hypothetical protein C8Q73DRAFT_695716 [Cubamyces lactineus]|nr:hypothetical protein C8Q73DRAFT_695716 [Cubamyces lactineus]
MTLLLPIAGRSLLFSTVCTGCHPSPSRQAVPLSSPAPWISRPSARPTVARRCTRFSPEALISSPLSLLLVLWPPMQPR